MEPLRDNTGYRLAQNVLSLVAERPFCTAVPEGHPSLCIHQDDRIAGRLDNRPQTVFAFLACFFCSFALGDVPGYGLESDYAILFQEHLHILADPHFATVFCEGRKFVIGARLLSKKLPAVKPLRCLSMVGMDQLTKSVPEQFLL